MNASSLHASNFSQQSQNFASLILGLKGAINAAKKFLSDRAFDTITLFASLLIYPVLSSARKKMRKSLSIQVQINKSNYRQMKLEYDALVRIIDQIDIQHLDRPEVPWYLRRLIRIIQDVRNLMIQRKNALLSAFNALDQQAPKTSLLTPLDQDALWNRRAQANEYR
jgi:hypothetical protein